MKPPLWFKRVIEDGMTGPDVNTVRRKLGLGDGPYDSTTIGMVRQLAKARKIETDGEVNRDVSVALGPSALESEDQVPAWFYRDIYTPLESGEDVRSLRGILGLGSKDDRYDNDAESAVRRFQSKHGIRPNGRVDNSLARLIGEEK